MDSNMIIGIVIVICIMLSAFFSCVETAFSTVPVVRLKNKHDNGNKKAKHALYICENFDKALTAILIMNNVVNLSCSSLATVLCISIWGDIGAAISTGGTTFLVLTFGEIIPKCIGRENNEAVALNTGAILKTVIIILTPLVFFFIKLKTIVLKLTHIKNNDPEVTEDELKYIIEKIEEQGVLEEQESEMVQSALDFDETTALEILTPRVDVTAIDINGTVESITNTILTERYSRIPVYEGNIDNIIGILHSRDYLEILSKNQNPDIKKLLTDVFFIYKTQKLSEILSEFKRRKLHIAIVTDEYGGTLGIVTMEDLLEEIVGEIWDEDEEIEKTYITLEKDRYLVSGEMELEKMLELFDIDTKRLASESVTVGGFIADNLGKIAQAKDSFKYEGLLFTVENASDQRVISAIISRIPENNIV